jgi:hypothetical protein
VEYQVEYPGGLHSPERDAAVERANARLREIQQSMPLG